MANLQRLFTLVTRERIAEIEYEMDQTFREFSLDRSRVTGLAEFKRIVTDCYRSLSCAYYHVAVAPPEGLAAGLVTGLLDKIYTGGECEAFQRARAGWDGGLPGVLQAITDSLKDELVDKWIDHALEESVDMQSLWDRDAFVRAYLERFKGALPPGFDPLPSLLVMHLRELVKAHVRMKSRVLRFAEADRSEETNA